MNTPRPSVALMCRWPWQRGCPQLVCAESQADLVWRLRMGWKLLILDADVSDQAFLDTLQSNPVRKAQDKDEHDSA